MLKTGHSFLGRLTPTIAMAGIDTVHYQEDCSECEKLRDDVVLTLHNIVESSEVLLSGLISGHPVNLPLLNKDLENAVEAKNRAFDALVRHRQKHGC